MQSTAHSSPFSREIAEAAARLRAGELVAFPTETVYGLGADATNPVAVAAVFEAKNRPTFDPLIVHVADIDQVHGVVCEFPETARILAERFWPGPLTLILPKRSTIPDLVTSGLPGVGVRIPDHPVARELIRLTDRPVAAPSANPFGRISPTTAEHVREGLGDRVKMILDGGPCPVGLESTVISLMTSVPTLLRPGGCALEDIEAVTGPVLRATPNPEREDSAQPAPGMLSRHYAPSTILRLLEQDQVAAPISGMKCGLLTDGGRKWNGGFLRIEKLSSGSDLRTCAANFFAALRTLDSAELDVIIAHKFPDHGLGIALNDRLKRAAAGSQPA